MTHPDSPPEGAQKALIDAGLKLFGTHGYDGTSTRAIAAEAGVNIALIAYHFGGKDGLRQACAREVARRIRNATETADIPPDLTAGQAQARLETVLRGIVAFLCGAPGSEHAVRFMLSEVTKGGPVMDEVYEAFLEPKHRQLSTLFAIASGQPPESDAVKLTVFSLLGQIAYFRLAAPLVSRRMGWPGLGPEQAQAIENMALTNLRCLLSNQGPTS